MTAWWRWYAALGAVGCAAYFVVPTTVWGQSVFVLVGASAVAATVVGTRMHRPRNRTAWLAIAMGTALWVIGDIVYEWIHITQGSVPYPSPADAIYLVGYPVYGFGLFLLARHKWRPSERGHVANSAIIMVAFGLLTWVFAVQPSLGGGGISGTAGLVDVAYPAMDIFLLGLLAHFVGSRQWRTLSYRLLTVAVALLVVTDTVNNFAIVSDSSSDRSVFDVGWIMSYVLIGVAALHPSMRRITNPNIESDAHLMASFTTPTVVVLTAATLTAPIVMFIEVVRDEPIAQWGWAVLLCALALVVLVMLRITDLLRLLHTQTVQLRAVADTDHLTGLANLRALEHRLWGNAGESTLLTVDIDRFKEINDTFGRGLGDQVLVVVAERLRGVADDSILLARLAGDEFALCGASESMDPAALAHRIQLLFATPFEVGNMTLLIEASVGVASNSLGDGEDETTPDRLVQRADLAVQAAKAAQSRVAYYDRSMDRDKSEQLIMLGELTTALETDQLQLHYQPQIDLTTMTVVGVEALLRWHHPNGTVLSPSTFLPTAERTGLIRPLTSYVLTQALAQRRQWMADGLELSIAVNISTRNLFDDTLIEQVCTALEQFDCPPRRLTVEVTETSAMTDPIGATETLSILHAMGVQVAIDDYGTGYSSLAYIERLPVQELKIDRTFIGGMAHNPAHAAIVRSTVELARTLGLSVTAEGVEDEVTMTALRELRCGRAQGYHLGRPTSADRLPALVAELNAHLNTATGERIS
ncbi:bifunctional diguanylate cyclase/phosphodiesterase [Rhodococcus sp. IEGM 1401]|uniref:putative bifunctional diguanylate cyclase/phosphodiesterase n=1 Tax=unclassified Rhodococcus (in: high G+C Gram-positive bacteria) TaxID=192944 RepID=UPI0022B52496|nr:MULTISPECIES: bifunctional diguanylate cyclase/phosphodiesterase [unclassified Rhodococcus (in: high G+C Gram-positive bacteria)]MCZ4564023.1 bifunctional diguanylate cyclase/phosphodiesterase [Rhodococcus sp. IEGM 1401]MDI9924162.1 bifunctional diguanylate cyclase/phosphodiesterase [Rhodococcus sp. IEGM 1372]MDV8036600.1 bifunctional diguanylate cyclase/phosphodiesterase [Rhodococcus sp. IEGM 1414]